VEQLHAAALEISMARKGNPYANAAAESFMKMLKCEEVCPWVNQTAKHAKKRLGIFWRRGTSRNC